MNVFQTEQLRLQNAFNIKKMLAKGNLKDMKLKASYNNSTSL